MRAIEDEIMACELLWLDSIYLDCRRTSYELDPSLDWPRIKDTSLTLDQLSSELLEGSYYI